MSNSHVRKPHGDTIARDHASKPQRVKAKLDLLTHACLQLDEVDQQLRTGEWSEVEVIRFVTPAKTAVLEAALAYARAVRS